MKRYKELAEMVRLMGEMPTANICPTSLTCQNRLIKKVLILLPILRAVLPISTTYVMSFINIPHHKFMVLKHKFEISSAGQG